MVTDVTNQKSRTVSSWLPIGFNLYERIGPFIRGKMRRVLNKTQTILYKRHIKTRLSKDASNLDKTRLS